MRRSVRIQGHSSEQRPCFGRVLFAAFAPTDDPKLAVAVPVENGGHGGSAAGPVAQRVFDAFPLGKHDFPAMVVEKAN